MMEKAGVVRDQHSLEAGLKTLDGLEREHGPALALTSARLVLMAALGRREKSGCTLAPGTILMRTYRSGFFYRPRKTGEI